MSNNLTRSLHKIGFTIKKHSPELCTIAGIGGMVVATVMACKATTKLDDILSEAKDTIDTINECSTNPDALPAGAEYSKEDAKKDLAITYTKTGLKVLKLYGPSLAVGVLSITSIVASNVILKKRNIGLAAAYTALDKSFKDYRVRVVDKFGEEIDKQLKYGVKAVEIEKEITDEDGNQKTVKETKNVVDKNNLESYSPYAKFFDELSDYWEKDPEYNLMFLRSQEAYANEKLKAKGYLFLNEVYSMLGIQETKAGQMIGWVYDPEVEHKIDFGIYDLYRDSNRRFVNGVERSILLDFNVDGNIWEQM